MKLQLFKLQFSNYRCNEVLIIVTNLFSGEHFYANDQHGGAKHLAQQGIGSELHQLAANAGGNGVNDGGGHNQDNQNRTDAIVVEGANALI